MSFRPNLILVALSATLMMASGCSASSSDGKTIAGPASYASLRDFTRVAVTGPDNVTVSVGKPFSVSAQGDAKTLERLDIKVVNGALQIGRKHEMGTMWSMSGDRGATIHVSMPAIAGADITGSGNMNIDQVQGKALKLSVTGSGNMSLTSVHVAALNVAVTGSGDIDLAGTADTVDLSSKGSGNVVGDKLKAARASVSVLGSGDVNLASDGAISVEIMGSGDVAVKGKAQCKTSVMGSGEVHCSV